MPRVILDGYNLLLRAKRGADQAAREALAREAARYRAGRAVEVVIVFDSAAGSPGAGTTSTAGVQVVFAAGDADRAILEMVRRSRSPRDVLVVTSDRRLAEQARDLGARTESGETFRARAQRRGARGAGEGTGERLSATEVEEWIRIFAERPPADEGD